MKNYHKIGVTQYNNRKFEVYEHNEHGQEVDLILVDGKTKIYRDIIDIDFIELT